MLLYPEVQEKARAEIDRVVGKDCLPTIANQDSTPYLNAVLLETLRWHPVVPLGTSRFIDFCHSRPDASHTFRLMQVFHTGSLKMMCIKDKPFLLEPLSLSTHGE